MIWFVRALVIGAFLLYAFVTGRSPILGILSGMLVIGLSLLVGKIGHAISRRVPVAARRAGNGFFWIGTALAVFSIGLGAYAAYGGASRTLLGVFVALALVYWAAGWGLRRALNSN